MEGDADLLEPVGERGEQGERIAVVDALRSPLGERRMPTLSMPIVVADGLEHLASQAKPVLDRAAIIVVAQIGAVAQELVDQIAVGAVDLDAVEAGRDRIAGGAPHNRR